MIARLFLLLLTACGCFGVDLGIGEAPSITTPRQPIGIDVGIDVGLGLGIAGPTFAQVMTAANFTTLNTLPLTVVRATSAWDPRTNAIVGAGILRTRTQTIGGTSYTSHLIEANRTSLLASGTSGRFDQWTAANGLTVTADTTAGPGGEVTAQTLTDPGASLSSARQTFTVLDDSLTHTFTIHVLKTTGGTAPTFGVTLALSGGTPVSTSARINTDTGAQQYGSNADTTVVNASATYWRVVVRVANNTTGNTTLTLDVYPAASAHGASVDAAAQTGSAICAMSDLIKSISGSGTALTYQSFISNRNCLLQTETLNTNWTKAKCTITSDSTANPLDSSVTADTIVEDGSVSGTHFIRQNFTKAAASIEFTFSVYMKQSGRTWGLLSLGDNNTFTSGNGVSMYFDVANGATGTAASVGTGFTLNASHITAVGSFYRVDIDVTTNTSTNLTCTMVSATGDAGKTYTGDGRNSLILYGAQLVYGAKPQSYWAVGTTVGARALDNVSIDCTSLAGGGISTTQGTLIAVVRPYGWNGVPIGTLPAFTRHSAAESVYLAQTSVTQFTAVRADAGGLHGVNVNHTWTDGVTSCIGITWNSSTIAGYDNGSCGGTTAPTALPYVAATSLPLGCNDSAASQCAYSYLDLLYSATSLTPSDMATFAGGVTP